MIASNYRKHPETLALQLQWPFGRELVWALPRPTTRILRQIRAARAPAFKAIGRIVYVPSEGNNVAMGDLRAAASRRLDVSKIRKFRLVVVGILDIKRYAIGAVIEVPASDIH